ncbi:phage head-tail joining protein [Mesorhizobium captivum]|uniref:phage head-tail joining protein n=1 Tax=Mesorhizobium captivum TaxID=3072319 RepID=UPI002A248E16|nr:hypothetical protein [Mesorhizobium sp. VK23E]MDX8513541.1 hypothetical protein [Mesorhizobium sp. VK23E]
MTTLSDLQAWLHKLKQAYYTGVKSVSHGGTTTTFQDMDKMRQAIADAEAEIGGLTGSRRPAAGYASFSRGDGS